MKRALFVFAALLIVVGFSAPAAQAQTCMQFTGFCDGLEVNVSGGSINGFWRNWDCGGSDSAVVGIIKSLPSPCGGNANAGVVCDAGISGCDVGGSSWAFMLDSLDGSMDMANGFPPNTCWIDELAYTTSLGPCPFAQDNGARPRTATTN